MAAQPLLHPSPDGLSLLQGHPLIGWAVMVARIFFLVDNLLPTLFVQLVLVEFHSFCSWNALWSQKRASGPSFSLSSMKRE